MPFKRRIISLLIFIFSIGNLTCSYSQTSTEDQHVHSIMRVIGHQLLLDSGDSTSLVLPIVKEEHRYKIQFDTEFELNQERLLLKGTFKKQISRKDTLLKYRIVMKQISFIVLK